ncbi:MAG: c-type cytochrome [Gammaproteobacteria bacterium]|nr:c-type cytochrome [Gammaproteobacteria bacterium]
MAEPYLKFAAALVSIIISGVGMADQVPKSDADTNRKEAEQASTLTPDMENGRKVFKTCALCHSPEGWGTKDGTTPEIAGQHSTVIIKQLMDIQRGNRDNPTMVPFTMPMVLNNQDFVDIAAYVEQLKMAPTNLMGSGKNLKLGKEIYAKECAKCHGKNGEGDAKEFYPKIHGQNYNYLLRQMLWIKHGKRRNANRKMIKQVNRFSDEDLMAVIDYSSRLRPSTSEVAKEGWTNKDFSNSFKYSPKYEKK